MRQSETYMDALNVSELYVLAGDQLDSLWEFFVTVHLAVAAALYGIEKLRKLKIYEYVLLGGAYLVFSGINLRAKIDAYQFLMSVEQEAEKIVREEGLVHMESFFSEIEFDDRVLIVWIIHIATVFIIAVLALTKNNSKGCT